MDNGTKLVKTSDLVTRLVRECRGISYFADRLSPPDSEGNGACGYYVDMIGDYGPTYRLFFNVRDENEIVGLISIVEGMRE